MGFRSRIPSTVPGRHLEQGDPYLLRTQRTVKTQQRQQLWPGGPGVDDREVVAHGHDDVAYPGQHALGDGAEQTLPDRLVPTEHPCPVSYTHLRAHETVL